jgi:hypothetical protein
MEARNKAIADAFARLAICASYCDRWITDYDFVRIIACEHDLVSDDTIASDVVLLNKALEADSRFKGAEDPNGYDAGTVFIVVNLVMISGIKSNPWDCNKTRQRGLRHSCLSL